MLIKNLIHFNRNTIWEYIKIYIDGNEISNTIVVNVEYLHNLKRGISINTIKTEKIKWLDTIFTIPNINLYNRFYVVTYKNVFSFILLKEDKNIYCNKECKLELLIYFIPNEKLEEVLCGNILNYLIKKHNRTIDRYYKHRLNYKPNLLDYVDDNIYTDRYNNLLHVLNLFKHYKRKGGNITLREYILELEYDY